MQQVSLLERMARAIEPPAAYYQKKERAASKPWTARRLRSLTEINPGLLARGVPRPAGVNFKDLRGRVFQYYTDGSIHHFPRRARGKAVVKAAKRARQAKAQRALTRHERVA